MLSTEFAEKFERFKQLKNALVPTVVTLSIFTTLFSKIQPSKALLPIEVVLDKLTEVIFEHPLNAFSGTAEGEAIVKLDSPEQLRKAFPFAEVKTNSGALKTVRFAKPLNTFPPFREANFGAAKDVRFVFPVNAPFVIKGPPDTVKSSGKV
jgi:hypothetical protein